MPAKSVFGSVKTVSTENAPWLNALSNIDPALLVLAVQTVLTDGAALNFSRTRDGGAICVTYLSGDTREKAYPSTVEELVDTLSGMIEALGGKLPPPRPKK